MDAIDGGDVYENPNITTKPEGGSDGGKV